MKLTADNMKNKKITILGAGLSGVAAANLAINFNAMVFISDLKINSKLKDDNITSEFGKHTNKCLKCDFAIISPGIPKNSFIINKIKKSNIPLISEIEFASWFTNSPIIGITGSNGKSTTCKLLEHILKKSKYKIFLGGNIGTPILNLKSQKKNFVIIEASSFQLSYSKFIHPK